MRKLYTLGLAFAAVFAFSAVAATAAFAESEWLWEGQVITASLAVTTTGLLTLDSLLFGILVVALDCTGSFDGTVGPGAEDEVTAVLNAAGEEVSKTPLTGLALSCKVETSANSECGPAGGTAEVWPVNLPWKTKIELDAGTTFLDDFPANSGYEVLCSNGKENKCEGLAGAVLTNEVGGVLGVFNESENEEACSLGTGHIGGEGLTAHATGGTLSVS